MGLDNSLEVVVHHILIGEMVGPSYWDGFPTMCALMCMVAHWIRPMVSNDKAIKQS